MRAPADPSRRAWLRFGPARKVEHTGVPADHFTEAPEKAEHRDIKRALTALRTELRRRAAREG